jgi:hypothetical protein
MLPLCFRFDVAPAVCGVSIQAGTLPCLSAFSSDKEARMLRPLHMLSALVIAVALQASLFGHAGAQSASSGSKDCVDATKKPATDDAKGPDSGNRKEGLANAQE